jgi:hypothetical protein
MLAISCPGRLDVPVATAARLALGLSRYFNLIVGAYLCGFSKPSQRSARLCKIDRHFLCPRM